MNSEENQLDEISQYDDESIREMIDLLLEGKVKREALIDAYMALWKGSEH